MSVMGSGSRLLNALPAVPNSLMTGSESSDEVLIVVFDVERCNFDTEGYPNGFLGVDIDSGDEPAATLEGIVRDQGFCVDNQPPSL